MKSTLDNIKTVILVSLLLALTYFEKFIKLSVIVITYTVIVVIAFYCPPLGLLLLCIVNKVSS